RFVEAIQIQVGRDEVPERKGDIRIERDRFLRLLDRQFEPSGSMRDESRYQTVRDCIAWVRLRPQRQGLQLALEIPGHLEVIERLDEKPFVVTHTMPQRVAR